MKPISLKCIIIFLLLGHFVFIQAQVHKVILDNTDRGYKIKVNEKDFFINGMNWDYFPIGTNYTYILWNQSDSIIRKALDSEMSLLKDMGVNTIRVYSGIPKKWISYIYEHHGIYTMLNHSFGRYGLNLDGQWVAQTNYADPRTEKVLLNEITTLANEYKQTPGLLLYLLGNENNYGLFWEGPETENIPEVASNATQKVQSMYQLFNKAAIIVKSIDPNHPVALCNGDLQYLDIIASQCKDFDIFGTNIYRGLSFGDAFKRVKNELDKPILLTEFGADAFNMKLKEVDESSQAVCLKQNWMEIYENAAGLGKEENCLGGFTFQFSDGWWKHDQSLNLNVHDTIASWSNGGYLNDFSDKENNMNEEWFGICAKGTSDESGHYPLYPRAAYFVLQAAHRLNPYSKNTTLETIKLHFENK